MNMYNLPHQGEFIRKVYIEPLEISGQEGEGRTNF